MTIAGVEDTAGYEAVKAGRAKVGKLRTRVTTFGKEQRAEALAWQKEVLRQEKELLIMIEPTETALKAMLEAVDEEKKRKEREILLPSRSKMLVSINVVLTDDQILEMDEKEFAEFFTKKNLEFIDQQEFFAKAKEDKARRELEIEKAKSEAAEKAVIAERERAEKEKADADRREQKRVEAEMFEAEQKRQAEKAEQAKMEKNRKYKAWLKKNEVEGNEQMFHIDRAQNGADKTVFRLYKLIDEITI